MKLIFALMLFSSVSYSQQDSIVLTTSLSVDSVLRKTLHVPFTQLNDSTLCFKIARNALIKDDYLVLFANSKKYIVALTEDPVNTFHGEWNKRDPKNPLTLRISVNKSAFVSTTADGSAVHQMSALAVYDINDNLLVEESAGFMVIDEKKKHTKSK